ncbi:hypothetical protein [Henriciella aquimarina]|uniref:hypothetical protein n=1 Tax=Henriciella aquimarina TaxID=545261 RepID=UPI00117B682A|nr:hypothetical protein [Henriciella aquimarina]
MAKDEHELRRAWASFAFAVRSVGHVASKVDAKSHPILASFLDSHFQAWKTSDALFIFLDEERNSIAKNGRSTAHFGIGNDFGKILILGQFKSAVELSGEILRWWETALANIEDTAAESLFRGNTV